MPDQATTRNVNIAVLYADADEEYWKELERHINLISRMHPNVRLWTAKDIELGDIVNESIRRELRRADITLLLLSADFAFEEVFDEETRILLQTYAHQKIKTQFILPVIVKDFMWQDHFDDAFDIEQLTVFDHIAKTPDNREQVYTAISEQLNKLVTEINARSIQMIIPTWVGYIGAIMYNKGFVKNKETTLSQKYKRTLRFELSDDMDQLADAYQTGEADLIWSTIDRLPSLLHRLKEYEPRVIFQASWSNGADAIIARDGIKKVEDLRGKKVIYPYNSPAFTFLRYVLRQHNMDAFDLVHQPQKQSDLDQIVKVFLADKTIDAAVLWSPYAEACLAEVPGTKIIDHSGNYPNLIADVVIAGKDFVSLNEEELVEFFGGWLGEIERFMDDQTYEEQALTVLIDAIIRPLPSIIPSTIRTSLQESLLDYFASSLCKVHLSNLAENVEFFGLTHPDKESPAGALYRKFLELQYPEFLTDPAMQWEKFVDTTILKALQAG